MGEAWSDVDADDVGVGEWLAVLIEMPLQPLSSTANPITHRRGAIRKANAGLRAWLRFRYHSRLEAGHQPSPPGLRSGRVESGRLVLSVLFYVDGGINQP